MHLTRRSRIRPRWKWKSLRVQQLRPKIKPPVHLPDGITCPVCFYEFRDTRVPNSRGKLPRQQCPKCGVFFSKGAPPLPWVRCPHCKWPFEITRADQKASSDWVTCPHCKAKCFYCQQGKMPEKMNPLSYWLFYIAFLAICTAICMPFMIMLSPEEVKARIEGAFYAFGTICLAVLAFAAINYRSAAREHEKRRSNTAEPIN